MKQMHTNTRKGDRWEKSYKTKRWLFEISRFINHECVSLGASVNWNLRPSLEVDFLFWRIYIESRKWNTL